MQVITLTPDIFRLECARLAKSVAKGHPEAFDATIAIRTGGVWVCDAISESLPADYLGERHDVTLQRPSTKAKNGIADKILPLFPRFILNAMRMAEALVLRLIHLTASANDISEVALDSRLVAILGNRGKPELLVVDDAVDSGKTLAAVRQSILKVNQKAVITSAAITVTTSSPVVSPDYALYSNHTLIRFPWSKDFRR